jgi:hypothetical protein
MEMKELEIEVVNWNPPAEGNNPWRTVRVARMREVSCATITCPVRCIRSLWRWNKCLHLIYIVSERWTVIEPLVSNCGASNEVHSFSHRCQESAQLQYRTSRKVVLLSSRPHKTTTHAISGFPNTVILMVRRTAVRQLMLAKQLTYRSTDCYIKQCKWLSKEPISTNLCIFTSRSFSDKTDNQQTNLQHVQ